MNDKGIAKAELTIEGMTCGHCAKHVSTVLAQLKGIIDNEVDHNTGKAEVTYSPQIVNEHAIRSSIDASESYKVSDFKIIS